MNLKAQDFGLVLVIDGSKRDQSSVALIGKECRELLTEPLQAQALQQLTEKLFIRCNKEVKDLRAIVCTVGPGSLTGLRIAATMANTFAWLYKIPLIAVKTPDDFSDLVDEMIKGKEMELVKQIKIDADNPGR